MSKEIAEASTFDNFEPVGTDESPEENVLQEESAEEGMINEENDDNIDETTDEVKGQVNELENQDETIGKKDGKDELQKDDDDEESEEKDEEQDGKEEVKEEKPAEKKKMIKSRVDGEDSGIPADAEIRVKIDGKHKYVNVQDLADNYSGKVSFEKKFSEISEQKKAADQEINSYKADKESMIGHLSKIAGILDDPNASPIEALNYLVDMSGRDVIEFEKKVFSSMSEEVDSYLDMSEEDRTAYWAMRENKVLKQKLESSSAKAADRSSQKEEIARIATLREAHGVSEEAFVSTYRQMGELGYNEKDLTPETVVDFAMRAPYYEKASSIVEKFQNHFEGDQKDEFIKDVAESMISDRSVTEADVVEMIEDLIGDNVIKKKMSHKPTKKVSDEEASVNVEALTFDDL